VYNSTFGLFRALTTILFDTSDDARNAIPFGVPGAYPFTAAVVVLVVVAVAAVVVYIYIRTS
jgi:hypothetical protein